MICVLTSWSKYCHSASEWRNKNPRSNRIVLKKRMLSFKKYSEDTSLYGFMIFGYQYSTSQHHAVYWELKSKCFSSGYLPGREKELCSPGAFLSTVIIPAQGNRYKGVGHLTRPFSHLTVFLVGSARCCCSRLHARLQH